jgi:phosphoglycolate phosphatase
MESRRMIDPAVAERGWPLAVLFDLDGTLVDSVADMAAATNILIARHGLGPLSVDDVKSMVGHGIGKLVERAFAACGVTLSPEALKTEHEAMIGIYGDHLTVFTTLLPGVREAVEALHGNGVRLAVVTNKPQRAAEALLAHFGLASFLDAVVGGDAGAHLKPAPTMPMAALERLRVEPWDAAMVGDSAADVDCARAAGLTVIIVRGGYSAAPAERLGADDVIESLDFLEDALARLRDLR